MTSYRIHSPLKAAALVVSVATIFTASAEAKNGPFPHGIGTQFGLGGAGTALAIDSSNADANPAVLTRVDTQLSAFFINFFQEQSLDSSRAPAGNPVGKQTNTLKNSPGGSLSANYVLNPQWAVGFATSGGATNIKYNASTLNPGALNPPNSVINNEFVNSAMLFSPTVSYRPTPCQSYGFAIILGYQTLKNNLAIPASQPPFSQTSGALRTDSATGVGARIGGLWDINRYVSFGASASTPVQFSKFKKYRDVLPRSFDLPPMFRLGTALHLSETDYSLDLKQIFFSQVRSLGDDLGWKNQTVLMFGVQHRLTPCLVVTAGYNHGNSPVRSNNVFLNSLIIPIARHHFTAGARYRLTSNWEMSVGAEFTPTVKMTDDGTGILGANGRGARIKNRDVGVLLGATYHFSK
jgi:long-chain fatty acid transport protein